MAQAQAIKTKPGRRSGELVVSLPPGWELRLRRVLREIMVDSLPDPHEKGLTEGQRHAREDLRRQRMRDAMCRFVSDLLTADIVGKEVALTTRNRYGTRTGSLREHVQAILREVASG
jgi:hypothetical protein